MRAQQQGDDGRVEAHRHRGAPAEGGGHEGAVPAPGAGHHQHRRRGIGGEGAADRDVDEQDAERAVLHPLGNAGPEHLGRQHQGRQRHRGRLGDQGARQRHQGQAEPAQRHLGAHRGQSRQQGEQVAHGVQHRARGGDHHHHEDEQRFGIVPRFDVADRAPAPGQQGHGEHQHEGPEAEHDFDFAQQVEEAGVARVALGQGVKQLGGKGMDEGDGEQDGADELDRGHGCTPWRAGDRLVIVLLLMKKPTLFHVYRARPDFQEDATPLASVNTNR